MRRRGAATGALLEEILDETFPVWGEGLARDAYGKYNRAQLATPWGAAHLRRVALVDGGRLLATAKRYQLEALVDRRPVKVLGLGAVFTPESRRGRGHAAELLRRMLDSAADEGFGLALLFSEIDPRYYEHLGLSAPLDQPGLAVGAGRSRAAARPPSRMRSGDFGDVASIVEMNRAQAERFRFALVPRRGLRAPRHRPEAAARRVRHARATARSSSSWWRKAAGPRPTSCCSRSAST